MRRPPALTVDGIVPLDGKIVLIRRGKPPFEGSHALPGGFVEYGETVEDAVVREILEETGLRTRVRRLIGVYSDPQRDPRGHTISVVFELEVVGGEMKGGDDALEAKAFKTDDLPTLAFDHEKILKDYLALISTGP